MSSPVAVIEKPSVEDFRQACKQFPENTGLGLDTFHPRWISQLSYETVSLLVDLMWSVECQGAVPDVLAFILIHLIPKRRGGKRPIGIATGLLRAWAKCRRSTVQRWEQTIEREH